MKIKLSNKRKDGKGHEWSDLISGYDCFETEEVLVSFLNKAGCNTYLNEEGEIIARCKAEEITRYMQKAEELYNSLY